jgi:hypothetical protein
VPDIDTAAYARASGIVERQVDDTLFLAEAEGEAIFHLNPTGAALWRLLAEPISLDEATQVFHQAFPDGNRSALETELAGLIGELLRCGLIVQAD